MRAQISDFVFLFLFTLKMVVIREQNRRKLGHILVWKQNDIDVHDIPIKEAPDRMFFLVVLL